MVLREIMITLEYCTPSLHVLHILSVGGSAISIIPILYFFTSRIVWNYYILLLLYFRAVLCL
jgi:hypothetical protein